MPIMIGIAQAPQLPGIIGAKNGAQAQPIVNGFFPPVDETIWCMEWQPLAEELADDQPQENAGAAA